MLEGKWKKWSWSNFKVVQPRLKPEEALQNGDLLL